MTKKHFIALAAAIKIARVAAANVRHGHSAGVTLSSSAVDVVDALAREIARIAADDNPRFDRDRFLAACGMEV